MSNNNESRMTVRMSSDLYEWLKLDAQNNLRSLNAQVIAILEKHRRQTENDSINTNVDGQ